VNDARLDWVLPRAEVQRILDEASALFRAFGLTVASLPASHRLRRIHDAVGADLQAHGHDGRWERGPDIVELGHTVRILRHSRSRQWLDLNVLRSSSNYRHDLTLMAAATYVAEAGNDVRPHPSASRAGPRPDMWIHVDTLSGPIEHKAPDRLNERETLTAADADRVIQDAFEKADHQIQAVRFAFVSLGGFRVPRAHLDEIRLAGERFFAAAPPKLRHVLGLLAFSIGPARGELPGKLPGLYGDRHPGVDPHLALAVEVDPRRFDGQVVPRVARNAQYSGPIAIRRGGEKGPGFYLPFG
jgi:hypothetical protein